jgi:hypothetical protein
VTDGMDTTAVKRRSFLDLFSLFNRWAELSQPTQDILEGAAHLAVQVRVNAEHCLIGVVLAIIAVNPSNGHVVNILPIDQTAGRFKRGVVGG